MASNLTGNKNETLSREDIIKKLNHIESVVIPSKDRIIQGQNKTIQTLTAQNLLFRELLNKVVGLKIGLLNKNELTKLQKIIRDKLNGIVIKNHASSTEILTEQNLILRDIVEQLLNLKVGMFSVKPLTKLQEFARKKLDEMRNR